MRTKWIAFIAGCMLLGCTNEDAINVSDGALVPLVVTAPSLLDVESTPTVSKSTTVIASGSLGVFLIANEGANYSAQSNVQYNYESNNSQWVCSANPIFLNNNEATMYSYYPYDGAVASDGALSLISGTTADLCYTKTAVKAFKSAPNASFVMEHAYSKLTINFKKKDYDGVGKIDNISILNASIAKKANLNLFTGMITLTEASTLEAPFSFNPSILSLPAYDVADASTVVSTSVLVIPVDALTGGSVVLSLTLDGEVKKTPVITMPEAKLKAGNNYVINVKVNQSGGLSVTRWGSTTSTSTTAGAGAGVGVVPGWDSTFPTSTVIGE